MDNGALELGLDRGSPSHTLVENGCECQACVLGVIMTSPWEDVVDWKWACRHVTFSKWTLRYEHLCCHTVVCSQRFYYHYPYLSWMLFSVWHPKIMEWHVENVWALSQHIVCGMIIVLHTRVVIYRSCHPQTYRIATSCIWHGGSNCLRRWECVRSVWNTVIEASLVEHSRALMHEPKVQLFKEIHTLWCPCIFRD